MINKSKIPLFLSKNWLSISGLAVGILGILLSLYFYELSIAEREPILLIDPVRTNIIDAKSFPRTTLKVLREDNTSIDANITSLRFYLWNNGKASIKSENILQPLIFSIDDPNAEILDYKVLKVSRPDIVSPNLKRDDKTPANRLLLNFNILEANDGFTGQIIFAGNPSANLQVFGVIEGVKEIQTNIGLTQGQFWKDLAKIALIILATVLIAVVFIILFVKAIDLREKGVDKKSASRSEKLKYYAARALFIMYLIFTICCVVWLFIFLPIKGAKEMSSQSVMETVPLSIKP